MSAGSERDLTAARPSLSREKSAHLTLGKVGYESQKVEALTFRFLLL
jgi:hypothetical protein